LTGDPAPTFTARASNNPRFVFDTIAGRYILLTFVRSSSAPEERAVIDAIAAQSAGFDDINACWFIVSSDPQDEVEGALPLRMPGIRAFHDLDLSIHRSYGVPDGAGVATSFLISPRMQVIGTVTGGDPQEHASRLIGALAQQVPVTGLFGAFGPPPILIIPNILEPDFCRMLITGYEKNGGEVSGFMREENGRTVPKYDSSHKVRRDWNIDDPQIVKAIQARFMRRVVPEIHKAYNFKVTRMERYIVSCYDAVEGGHFRAHRDNTTRGTAHRRFACSVNLNAEEFEGGNLRFPEFGPQTYRPPTGGCVIFGCSLLHEATRVTKGKRYAFLPFLYDDEAARIRQENLRFLGAANADGPEPTLGAPQPGAVEPISAGGAR
jgi:predicted 2-oxoglutarate/Fe(II)-dependent dioxygenase YbiX/peroxiredoxin